MRDSPGCANETLRKHASYSHEGGNIDPTSRQCIVEEYRNGQCTASSDANDSRRSFLRDHTRSGMSRCGSVTE